MMSRFWNDPFFYDPFFIASPARVWGFSDPFEDMRRDPVFRDIFENMDRPMITAATSGATPAEKGAKGTESKQLTTTPDATQNWLTAYARAPHVDIVQRDNEYVVNIDVPGVKKEDIKLNLSEDARGRKMLTVSGERKEESSKDEKGVTSRRSMYGKFSRTLMLPEQVDTKPEAIKAKHEDGVLKISLPRLKEPDKKSQQEIAIR